MAVEMLLTSFYMLQVFYTSFFTADKELYPDEVFATDSLANAIVVRHVCIILCVLNMQPNKFCIHLKWQGLTLLFHYPKLYNVAHLLK